MVLCLCGCGSREEALPASREEMISAVRYVALTFDDGPSPYTEQLLNGLHERDVKATFFLLGCQLEGREALVQRMAEEGHQIGSHTRSHALLTELSTEAALAELADCDLALCTLLGERDYWVRPPYGAIGGTVLQALDVPVVGWSVDPRDWATDDAQAVAQHILCHAEDGDIILLHDCYRSTVEGTLRAVDALLAMGIQPVTVKELLRLRGIEAESGRVYYCAG